MTEKDRRRRANARARKTFQTLRSGRQSKSPKRKKSNK